MSWTAYVALLRRRDFRRFWIGMTLSVLGDSFTRVAFIWFVYQQTGSSVALGWLTVCYLGPILFGGFVAGWALDRFDRRLVMALDNLLRGAAIAIVPLLYWLDLLLVWHIYAAAACYGLLMMVSLAGTPALIPALAKPEELTTANALESLSYTLGGVIGPMLAGFAIAAFGAPMTVLIDVASYLLFALALFGLSPMPPHRTGADSAPGFGAALHLFLRHPVLLSTTLMFMVFNLGGGALEVWLPILVSDHLGNDPRLYGALLAALALGETLSSLLAGALGDQRLGLKICGAQILSGLAVLLIATFTTLPAAALGLLLLGAFSAPMTIWAQSLRMAIIPPELRGRMFALLRMVMQLGNPLGGMAGGWIMPVIGLSATIGLSAAAIGAPALAGLAVKQLRLAQPDRV